MAEETHIVDAGKISKKRRVGHKKGSKGNKRMKVFQISGQKPKIDKKLRELFRKRAREYNSDDEDEESKPGSKRINENVMSLNNNRVLNREFAEEQGGDAVEVEKEKEVSEGEEEKEEIQPGITKFTGGCRTFRMAFKKIMKKNVSEESLGPVLSAHKKLIAAKLAEEDAERKVKGDAKKEKHLVGEKGHVKPANFLDSHEKFLIGIATKGVVKLFNAVNKAQNAQKGLNPLRSKDAKAIGKQRKEAFFSELSKTSSSVKVAQTSGDGEGPGWAPLRDNYMLANSKLKNWDKMPVEEMAGADDDNEERMTEDSSDDDD